MVSDPPLHPLPQQGPLATWVTSLSPRFSR